MDDSELARIKTAWSDDRERTHSEGCRQWHPECAVVGLVGEVERLRAHRDALLSALNRTERGFVNAVNSHPVLDMSETLAENDTARALLEENHDDRPKDDR